jgi:hypothetical protein
MYNVFAATNVIRGMVSAGYTMYFCPNVEPFVLRDSQSINQRREEKRIAQTFGIEKNGALKTATVIQDGVAYSTKHTAAWLTNHEQPRNPRGQMLEIDSVIPKLLIASSLSHQQRFACVISCKPP